MPRYSGISRDEYWLMRGEPTYVKRTPRKPSRKSDMRDPGVPVGECSHGHANCSRH